jgi:hypothetical protein
VARPRAELVERAPDAVAALIEDVRVNHRGGHVYVAEQFLDGPDVVAGLQQVRRERVALMPRAA